MKVTVMSCSQQLLFMMLCCLQLLQLYHRVGSYQLRLQAAIRPTTFDVHGNWDRSRRFITIRKASERIDLWSPGKTLLASGDNGNGTGNSTNSNINFFSTFYQLRSVGVDQAKNISTVTGDSKVVNSNKIIAQKDAELNELKLRLDKLEKSLATLTTGYQQGSGSTTGGGGGGVGLSSTKSSVADWMGAFNRGQLPMSPKTVERCSIVCFFVIGILIGASLLDRLWLLGGIMTAWWASDAVHRNTRSGNFVRRCGAQLAQFIRDWQEKYNQAVIFYQTGKLAYVSSKTWEKYDQQFAITQRANTLKKLAIQRASAFNSTMLGSSRELYEQMSDVWNVIMMAPSNAVKLDREYQLTSSISAYAVSTYYNTLGWIKAAVSDDNSNTRRSDNRNAMGGVPWPLSSMFPRLGSSGTYRYNGGVSYRVKYLQSMGQAKPPRVGVLRKLFRRVSSLGLYLYTWLWVDEDAAGQRQTIRGRPINPWSLPFWGSQSQSSKDKRKSDKKYLFF